MDQNPQVTNFERLVPEFKAKLSSHGIDTSKLDDRQWTEVLGEIQPLFADGYGEHAETADGTYGR